MPDHSQFRVPFARTWCAELISAYDRAVGPGALVRVVPDGPAAFWKIRAGSARITALDGSWKLRATVGQTVLLPEGDRRHELTPGTRLLSLRFRLIPPSANLLAVHKRGFRLNAAEDSLLAPPAAVLARLDRQMRAPVLDPEGTAALPCHVRLAQDLEWRGHFSLWLVTLLPIIGARGWLPPSGDELPPPLARFIEQLRESRSSAPPSLPDLLATSGVSASTMKRLARRHLGIAPLGLLNRERYERALVLLRDPKLPLKQISAELGFRAPSHFSSWFRGIAHRSPREFRAGLDVQV